MMGQVASSIDRSGPIAGLLALTAVETALLPGRSGSIAALVGPTAGLVVPIVGWRDFSTAVLPVAPIAGQWVGPTAALVAWGAGWASSAVALMMEMAALATVVREVSMPVRAFSIGAPGAASIAGLEPGRWACPVSAGNWPRCPVMVDHRVAEVGS